MIANEILFTSRQRTITFQNPKEVIAVTQPSGVVAALSHIESEVAAGKFAAGYLAYEAASAFDPALTTHSLNNMPVLWFGLFEHMNKALPAPPQPHDFHIGTWTPAVSPQDYNNAIARIRDWIAAGDTYQVNYTFPMFSQFAGDPRAWFEQLCRAQRADYCALLRSDAFDILSISPELFFSLDADIIEMRPMKGTRPRGLYPKADRHAAETLAQSEKDRAENVMIVDLIRNDLGRICQTGSVEVKKLFELEKFQTVWQMTSSITGRTHARLPEIFAALFPSGSVTGAPKVRTMEIIRNLEPFPRGVYCGAIGWAAPGRRAEFNVAIRTITINRHTKTAQYHVGGGITWDSNPDDEFDECQAKTAFLNFQPPEFELLETILWNHGYALLTQHLDRLAASAGYFGFAFDRPQIINALNTAAAVFEASAEAVRVRLLLARNGALTLNHNPIPPPKTWHIGFAATPIDPGDVFLYHKTSHRALYDAAKQSRPDCDDVLLWNTRGEVTESTIANVLAEIDGILYTPPVSCGLLAGTMRAHLLAAGLIQERILSKHDIRNARALHLINAVRGWWNVQGGLRPPFP